MNELLQHVLDAHGGLEPWSRFNFVQATIMTGGELFAMKNEPQEPIPRTSSYSLPSHAADDPLRSRQRRTVGGDIRSYINHRRSFVRYRSTRQANPGDRRFSWARHIRHRVIPTNGDAREEKGRSLPPTR